MKFSDHRPRFGLPLGLALYFGTFVVSFINAAWADQRTGIVRIGAEDGRGHGCVVEGRLITARHVGARNARVTWSDFFGREGTAVLAEGERDPRDIVVLKPTPDVGSGFKLATQRPLPGDRVTLFGYARGKRNPLELTTMTTKVVARSDGYFFYEDSPGPGSSGSCVLNAQGEVLGINVGMWTHSDTARVYFAVEITGPWGLK